jgi:hypothetical protein
MKSAPDLALDGFSDGLGGVAIAAHVVAELSLL